LKNKSIEKSKSQDKKQHNNAPKAMPQKEHFQAKETT